MLCHAITVNKMMSQNSSLFISELLAQCKSNQLADILSIYVQKNLSLLSHQRCYGHCAVELGRLFVMDIRPVAPLALMPATAAAAVSVHADHSSSSRKTQVQQQRQRVGDGASLTSVTETSQPYSVLSLLYN